MIGLGLMEARWVGFSCRIGLSVVTVVRGLDLGRGPVIELAVDPLLLEPRHPGPGGDLRCRQGRARGRRCELGRPGCGAARS